MNRVVRGTMAFMLVGLVLVILTGAAYAQTWQEAYPVESYGPNQIVLEKYSVAVASVQNWDKTNPVEYYGAYQMAMAQYNPALMAEQGWDSTHTVEYYSALQTAPAAPMIVESSDSSCYILRSGCGSRPAAPMIVESSDGATQMAMAQYNPALMGEQGWDSTHTVEYYSALQTAPAAPMIVESSDGADDEATCNQC